MRWPPIVAALILGLLLGGGAVLVWTELAPRDGRDLTARTPAQISQPRLSQVLMARVARKLIAVRSPNAPMRDGAVLFDAPQPYGGALCSVRAYAFPAWIVRGRRRPDDAQRPEQDDLRVTERYAVWRAPGDPIPPGLTPAAACVRLNDVQHLILGDGPAVERDVAVVDQAIRQARAGAVPFALTCADSRPGQPPACDGMAILRRAEVRHIRQVGGDWAPGPTRADHLDMVFMDARAAGSACGQSESLSFQLSISPGPTGDDVLRALKIGRDIIC